MYMSSKFLICPARHSSVPQLPTRIISSVPIDTDPVKYIFLDLSESAKGGLETTDPAPHEVLEGTARMFYVYHLLLVLILILHQRIIILQLMIIIRLGHHSLDKLQRRLQRHPDDIIIAAVNLLHENRPQTL